MSEPFVVRPRGAAPSRAQAAASASSARRRGPVLPGHPVLDRLAPHLDAPDITDVFLNGADRLYVDRGDGPVRVEGWRACEDDVRELAVALVSAGGRHLDDAAPCVDVRLESGARVHAVLPPVSTAGTLVSLRIPRLDAPALAELEVRGMMPPPARGWLESLVAARENLLISGAAGSGKTTLLAALLAAAPESDRIVTIEDVAELRPAHPHHVALQARQPNLEGAGGVGLARLVREALRMRPDRLVVGECRGDEVRELLSALNTGHDGGAGTLHANGLGDVPARLEALGALAGLDDRALARQAVSAIGWVLHLDRDDRGVRRLAGAGRLIIDGDRLGVVEEVPWAA
ncbi:MAG: TadA family conjugal transfer-associated ATPase [Microbacterium sp.]